MKKLLIVLLAVIAIAGAVYLEEREGLLRVGEQAPVFTALLSTGEEISLQDYRGKTNVVLFFYPKDETLGCTEEVCSYRDNYDQIRRYGAVVFGVSSDGVASHTRFIALQQLPFQLICDTDLSLSKLYGAARLGGHFPLAKRVSYVIDKDGNIRGVVHHEFHAGRHVEEVLAILRSM
ncbi:MAG TPA: peroxiredoxin [Bacteroidota bacterium]|nr:peroxiredoxin [Bacteroidota bacterium]